MATDGANVTRFGWAELFKVVGDGANAVETLIARGKYEQDRGLTTKDRRAPFGTTTRPTRQVVTESKDEFSIETDEFTDPINCIRYNLPIGTVMTAAIAPGSGLLHEDALKLKLYDMADSTTPIETRDAFDGYLSIDGNNGIDKDDYGKVKVKCVVGANAGTVLIPARS